MAIVLSRHLVTMLLCKINLPISFDGFSGGNTEQFVCVMVVNKIT